MYKKYTVVELRKVYLKYDLLIFQTNHVMYLNNKVFQFQDIRESQFLPSHERTIRLWGNNSHNSVVISQLEN